MDGRTRKEKRKLEDKVTIHNKNSNRILNDNDNNNDDNNDNDNDNNSLKNVKYKLDSPPSSASNQKAARSRHGQPLTVFSQYFTISDNYLEYFDNHVYSVYLYSVN